MSATMSLNEVGAGASRHAKYKVPGGKLVVIDFRLVDGHLAQVQLSGDFFMEPVDTLDVINAALEGLQDTISQAAIATQLDSLLGDNVMLFGISADAIGVVVRRALDGWQEASI